VNASTTSIDSSSKELMTPMLHQDATPALLVFFARYMFTIWFLRYLFDPLPNLSLLPVEYTDPVGWVRILPGFLIVAIHSFWGLMAIKLTLLASCVGVWFRRTQSHSALVACVMLTTVNAIVRGFGHANHCEIAPLIVTWILSIFLFRIATRNEPNADARTETESPVKTANTSAATGLMTATIALGLCYAFVGIARLVNGGFELFAGDTIIHHAYRASYNDWVLSYDFSQLITHYPWIGTQLKIGTFFVTLVEIAVPFALISRRIRWMVLLIMPAFHIGAMCMFKVIFVEQILTLFLLVNVGPILNSIGNRKNGQSVVTSLRATITKFKAGQKHCAT